MGFEERIRKARDNQPESINSMLARADQERLAREARDRAAKNAVETLSNEAWQTHARVCRAFFSRAVLPPADIRGLMNSRHQSKYLRIERQPNGVPAPHSVSTIPSSQGQLRRHKIKLQRYIDRHGVDMWDTGVYMGYDGGDSGMSYHEPGTAGRIFVTANRKIASVTKDIGPERQAPWPLIYESPQLLSSSHAEAILNGLAQFVVKHELTL